MENRYDELDSLRGLAALTVLFGHFLLVLPDTTLTNIIQYGPTRIFVSGSEAVCLFFVLSGFVLSLPFFSDRYRGYVHFAIRRICRIYIPYAVSIIAAIVLCSLFFNGPMPNHNEQISIPWSGEHNWNLIIQHFLFFGNYNYSEYNPAIWSLIHELRISLIFPLLMVLLMKCSWRGILLLYIFFVGMSAVSHHYQVLSDSYNSTTLYISLFLIGASAAKYRKEIAEKLRIASNQRNTVVLIIGIVSYLFIKPSFVIHHYFGMDAFNRTVTDSTFIVFGATLIIISAMNNKNFKSFLLLRPVHFFGKISYSLYLFQAIIILALLHWLNNTLPIWIIMPLIFFVTLAISMLSYKFVEVPSIRFGKKLTTKDTYSRLIYFYHKTMRKLHKREGHWQAEIFQHHRNKVKDNKLKELENEK